MTKDQIEQAQAAFARLSSTLTQDLNEAGATLANMTESAARTHMPLGADALQTIRTSSREVDRTCSQLHDLRTLEGVVGAMLRKITDRIAWSEARETQQKRWSYAVRAHWLNGSLGWVYAGTFEECEAYVRAFLRDEVPEQHSICPMPALEAGQKLAARDARERHDLSLDDIPF